MRLGYVEAFGVSNGGSVRVCRGTAKAVVKTTFERLTRGVARGDQHRSGFPLSRKPLNRLMVNGNVSPIAIMSRLREFPLREDCEAIGD